MVLLKRVLHTPGYKIDKRSKYESKIVEKVSEKIADNLIAIFFLIVHQHSS